MKNQSWTLKFPNKKFALWFYKEYMKPLGYTRMAEISFPWNYDHYPYLAHDDRSAKSNVVGDSVVKGSLVFDLGTQLKEAMVFLEEFIKENKPLFGFPVQKAPSDGFVQIGCQTVSKSSIANVCNLFAEMAKQRGDQTMTITKHDIHMLDEVLTYDEIIKRVSK